MGNSWVTKDGKTTLVPDAPPKPIDRDAAKSAFGAVTGGVNKASAPLRTATNPPVPPVPPTPPGFVPPVSAFSQNTNPVQPISMGGGQHYNPTTAPFGFDQSTPGYEEQNWQNNQNLWMQNPTGDWVQDTLPEFSGPWASETKGQEVSNTIGQPGAFQNFYEGIRGGMNTKNNAQTAFDLTQGRIPDSFQPQFDAYYDRMKDKVMGDVAAQGAARGVYGSSGNLNGTIGAGLDIEAERAKAATDFMLKDSENQRSWLDSFSNQGRAADLSGNERLKTYGNFAQDAERLEFDKNKEAFNIAKDADEVKHTRLVEGINTAFGIDDRQLNRVQGAQGAASGAQQAFENRTNKLYEAVSGFSSDVQDFVMENYSGLINGDGTANDQAIEAAIAKAADERGWSDQQQERIFRDVKAAIDLAIKASNPTPAAPAAASTPVV